MTNLQMRGGTAAAWTVANPTLLSREMGVETDTGKFKIGDGVTPWVSLVYSSGASGAVGAALERVAGDQGDDGPPGPPGGMMTYAVTRSIFLPAALAKLDAATAANLGASPNLSGVVAYADAATQGAFWTIEIPRTWNGGPISVQCVWVPGATDAVAHTVRWSFTAKKLTVATDVTAAGTNTLLTGASAARTVNLTVFDTITSLGVTPAIVGDLLMLEVQRIGADAADTYVGVVNLLGIIVTFSAVD